MGSIKFMPDEKAIRPDDKTILKTADEVAKASSPDENTPARNFIPYLVIVDGPRAGTRFQLKEGENQIGRSVSSAALLEDASVSRRHAILNHSRAGWIVQDLGSKNGSFVNGKRVKEQVNIGHGDVVRVGIYTLRLITKPVTNEEEMASPPSEVEGKTVMISADMKEAGEPHAETRTMAETSPPEGGGTSEFNAAGEDLEGGGEAKTSPFDTDELPPEPVEVLENKRKRILLTMIGGVVVLVVVIAVLMINLTGGKKPAKPQDAPPALQSQVAQPAQVVPAGPKVIPVFLDFASSPLPATVSLDGKSYGMAPSKVNVELEPGREYTAEAVFNLDELQDSLAVRSSFTIEPSTTMVPVFFKGPIGIIKVVSIPRDAQLYIEGYYASDPFKPHTAKLSNVVFGKPVYVPYGKYSIELRQPKQLGESNQFIEDIRFKREVQITEDGPLFELSVTDQDLQIFPVEIRSVPERADVFIDAQMVGQTPYKGNFPLGEHTLVLRKDGYFEHSQSLKMDINTPYLTEATLKTTVAGQFLNAGNALIMKGLYKDAVAQLSEAFKNQPTPSETAQAQYLLGVAYLSSGDNNTAAGYFEQAKANPDFEFPSKLGLATIYGLQQNMAMALPLIVEVLVKSQDEKVKSDAHGLFRQLSPLRSVMYIYTDPEGAIVTVNDKPVAQKTPLILHDMGLGNYKIRIQKDGFVPQDLNINMSIAEFNPVIIKLKPVEE